MHMERIDLEQRLSSGETLLLDGATGTELERRGASTALPLWSAPALRDQPELVEAIHADYAAAGVDALTANTFRTQRRALSRGGWGDQAGALTQRAVALAQRAAAAVAPERRVFVLGSAPTLEDCYRPDLVPDDATQAYVTGIVERDGRFTVWITVRTTGELLRLGKGAPFDIGLM